MRSSPQSADFCPKCGSAMNVSRKILLIGKESPLKMFKGEERAGYQRKDQLAVDEVLPSVLRAEPLSQFLDGFYCSNCDIGFVLNQSLQPITCGG